MSDPTPAGPRAGHHQQPPRAAPSAIGLSAAAFERIARERRGALLHAARRGTHCREDAEDAVQEALARAFERRRAIRPATAFAYIAVIAIHEATRLRRLAARCDSLDVPVCADCPAPLVECRPAREQDLDGLLDALDGLRAVKPDEARAVMARALGWPYAHICDAFGWTYTKTDRCLKEGRAALRRRAGA
jgi:DNA-directed RNA polymerase specialized sigma24 family protein